MIPPFLVNRLERFMMEQLVTGDASMNVDFTVPLGEPALASSDSVSWRVFRNPVSLYIGGITAVLMEFAEPRVRSGVWDHTTFRTDPLRRMRRTGLAAMVTVYGARSVAERMIAGVGRMHARIAGHTPDGTPYQASDPELLRWVHATALFGFMEAYDRFVAPLTASERSQFVAEGVPAAQLYGAINPPANEPELQQLFLDTLPDLEPSEIILEFLDIMNHLPLFPWFARPLGKRLVRAAIACLPSNVREALDLSATAPLSSLDAWAIRCLGRQMDRWPLASMPSGQACTRLGLPGDFLSSSRRQGHVS